MTYQDLKEMLEQLSENELKKKVIFLRHYDDETDVFYPSMYGRADKFDLTNINQDDLVRSIEIGDPILVQ